MAQGFTLSITFYFRTALKRDLDGGLKITQDALCEALGINDNRIQHIHLFKTVDRTTPRIELTLTTLQEPKKTGRQTWCNSDGI